MNDVTIRLLRTASEMDRAVELQQIYWGDDMSANVPAHMLLSIAKYGGHVHGAFVGDTMVGMLLGFLGSEVEPESDAAVSESLLVMSKRMVVLPEYRGHKIGERLKLAQREYALRHGIQLVTWTFDPLLSRNAYLNLHKLAGIGQRYIENYFGTASVGPNLGGDRLVVNWWVGHPATENKLAHGGERVAWGMLVNTTSFNDAGYLVPLSLDISDSDSMMLQIPMEFVPLERNQPELAQKWRDHVKTAFQQLFAAGYLATDFVRYIPDAPQDSPFADDRERVAYIFTRDDGTYTFH